MPYDDPRSADQEELPRGDATPRPDRGPDGKPNEARPDDRRDAPRGEPADRKGDADKGGDDKSGDDRGGGGGKGDDKQKRRSPWLWPIVIVVALIAIGGGFYYWYSGRDEATTDDAYTDGRAITVAPQVSGYVVDLAVNDNQFVHAGDPLLHIDPRLYAAARDEARGQLEASQGQLDAARAALDLARVTYPARLAAAQAQRDAAQALLTRAQADLKRQQSVPRQATTQQEYDQATAGQRQAQAQLAEAEANLKQAEPVTQNLAQVAGQVEQLQGEVAKAQAQLDQAELNLGYTSVVAPQDGWVTKRNVERGNYVTAGAAVLSLVSPQVWITANFKENQLNRMRPGQHVQVRVDAYPGLKLEGHVDSVQLGTGSRFTAFPPENATGNFVKIVQRVPVKIVIDSGLDPKLPLPLGLSVDPVVDLK